MTFSFFIIICVYSLFKNNIIVYFNWLHEFIKITINPNAIDELKIEMIGLLSHMRLGDVWSNYLKGEFSSIKSQFLIRREN